MCDTATVNEAVLGCDRVPHLMTRDESSVCYFAVEIGNLEICSLILETVGDENPANDDGCTLSKFHPRQEM